MLLQAQIDPILEEKCYKKNMVRFFYSGGGKMVFALLTEVIVSHVIFTPLKIKKVSLKEKFIRAFFSHKSGFHYCTNDILYVPIYINS